MSAAAADGAGSRASHRRWRVGSWGGPALLALIALALAAPLIAPQDPSDPLGFDPGAANHPPALSWTYLLGADTRGRSVLALLLWGSRPTLAIGLGAALLAAALGLLLGALALWRGGLLDVPLSRLMDLCATAPPLLVLLVLSGRLGGVPAALMLAVFALTGWVGPARLSRATLRAEWTALHLDAARAAGVGGLRLLTVHLLPAALAPLAAWIAGSAAMYVALEAGLDFLGLGLSPATMSWGTVLAGAQDALSGGNWWWMAGGGAALAATTLALNALARDIGRALDPTAPRRPLAPVGAPSAAEDTPLPARDEIWPAPARPSAAASPRRPGTALVALVAMVFLLGGVTIGARVARSPRRAMPDAHAVLQRALLYPHTTGLAAAYIATAAYVATANAMRGRQVAWAAWSPCPSGLGIGRCAQSAVSLWYSDGRARALTEGSTAICTPHQTWILNPMAGLAETNARACGPLGPELGALGTTAGAIAALLPDLQSVHPRLLGSDVVAGRRCWLVALGATGRLCADTATGLALRVERLDRAGQPRATFSVTALSFGLDLAPQLFANPIPGGRGPLVNGLTQPLLDLQAADDIALFITLVPGWLPRGLLAQTPTFDSFYDQTRGYAPQQRVRQAYTDRSGRVAMTLIETLAGSAWDVTPSAAAGRSIRDRGQSLTVWPSAKDHPAVVRRVSAGTAVLVSSRVLPLAVLEEVAERLT